MARYCLHPGCAVVVPSGRCPTHHAPVQAIHERFKPGNYGRPWRRKRDAYLEQAYPWWCAIQGPQCTARGRMLLRQEVQVDHRIPHRGDVTLRDDPNNYQVLCKACHDAKTARESWSDGKVTTQNTGVSAGENGGGDA